MKISIIEDDSDLAEALFTRLTKNGYLVNVYKSKKDFFYRFSENSDLYIVDLNLGNNEDEGFEIIKWLRNKKNFIAPIIILSGYSNTDKKIYGLDIGADDYLTKPFFPDELMAKIRAMLRRNSEEKASIVKYKDCLFDLRTRSFVNCGLEKINFTTREALILELFMLNKNKIIPKNKIVTSIWGDYSGMLISDNNINVTFFHLRKKIGDFFELKTIIGKGYILNEE